MSDNINYLELLRNAQLGDRESENRLAELTRGKVCAYIYRIMRDKPEKASSFDSKALESDENEITWFGSNVQKTG